jgi:hypothetical protein
LESNVSNAVVDFYRCPPELVELPSLEECHFLQHECSHSSRFVSPGLPSDLSRIIDNLRLERYNTQSPTGTGALLASEAARRLYYLIRPALSASLRQTLQRLFLRDWDQLPFPRWPVDTTVEEILERHLFLAMKIGRMESLPFIWFWPEGAPSAAIMTHDVEACAGLAFVPSLINIDDKFGIKASFQLIPEGRYVLSNDLLEIIRQRQCEVNVHGLNHDGNLFGDRSTFLQHCGRINQYVREFRAEGFRSACMYRNVDWYEELEVSYDMSVPNVAHLEPQRGGCCTVFPYFIGKLLELPLTTIQDYSLFHILGDYSIELWKKQIELIIEKHGLISFITHPDYLLNPRSIAVYTTLLAHLSDLRREKQIWIARPGDINRWWRERDAMRLVCENGKWCIEGEGRERARIGVAYIQNERITYTVAPNSGAQAELYNVSREC